MASAYPGALDNFATNRTVGDGDPAADYNNTADAVNKIEAELGVDPAGSFATVKARLDAFEGGFAPSSPNAANDEFTNANGTDPTTTGWAWGNQDGVVAEIRDGRLVFDIANSANRGFHGLFKPFPAGTSDVTVVARVNGNFNVLHHGVGVILLFGTLATPTRLEVIYIRTDYNRPGWGTFTSFALAGGVERQAGGNTGPTFQDGALGFRYVHSGTTVQALVSRDPRGPEDFTLYGSAVNPASARPDFFGIFASDQTGNPAGRSIQLWAEYFRVNWATA